MEVLLPCVRRAKKSDGSASPFDIKFGMGPGDLGTAEGAAAIAIMATMLIFAPELFFFIPFISIGWEWAFEQLGFGATHIEIQKKQIQSYLTPMFKIAAGYYGYPLADDHALNFESSGVRREFRLRPDLAVLVPAMWTDADSIITGAFGYDRSGPGIRQRFVNQFLANAAYNNWPVQAALDLWHGLVLASTCPKTPPNRPPDPPPPEQPPPPPGPWQYRVPIVQSDWIETFQNRGYPFPDNAVIYRVPESAWPYDWPAGSVINIVQSPGTGGPYPQGTLIVITPGQPIYAIDTTGKSICVPPAPEGPPDPPDVGDPPPVGDVPDLSIPLAQLRKDFEGLRTDYQQFKGIVFQQFDSLKDVIWRTNIRGNFQAAEVYAADQPAWQGPRPAAQQPPLPPAWQALPTPGVPQVLELPPIQEFPQAPGEQPVDLTGLYRELDELREIERQTILEIERVRESLLYDIGQAIIKYDRDVEKPDLQKLRDECCQPDEPPPAPEPVDDCDEGRRKWGLQAECWLEKNGVNPYPIDADIAARPPPIGESTDFTQAMSTQPSGPFAERRSLADAAFEAGFNGQWHRATNSYSPRLRTWIYKDPTIPVT